MDVKELRKRWEDMKILHRWNAINEGLKIDALILYKNYTGIASFFIIAKEEIGLVTGYLKRRTKPAYICWIRLDFSWIF
jgi:hypothetical protein